MWLDSDYVQQSLTYADISFKIIPITKWEQWGYTPIMMNSLCYNWHHRLIFICQSDPVFEPSLALTYKCLITPAENLHCSYTVRYVKACFALTSWMGLQERQKRCKLQNNTSSQLNTLSKPILPAKTIDTPCCTHFSGPPLLCFFCSAGYCMQNQ